MKVDGELARVASAVCVLRMSRRSVDEPDGPMIIVNDVAHPPAARYFVLPLFEFAPTVAVRGLIPAKPVLPVVIGVRARVRAQDLQTATSVRQR